MSNRPITVAELERRRLATAASLSKDLEAITAWGLKNMVEFNASKTQYCLLSNKRCPSEHSVLMNIQALPRSHSFKARKFFSPSNLLSLYKDQIRPSLQYCSHIWGAAPTTLSILDAVKRRAIRLIGDPALTCHLQPLSHRRAVGDLSLFYRLQPITELGLQSVVELRLHCRQPQTDLTVSGAKVFIRKKWIKEQILRDIVMSTWKKIFKFWKPKGEAL
nr:unnamed protein product [Callosobruchus chinensis]